MGAHTPYPTKITFGEMRESGIRDVLIYCRDHLQPSTALMRDTGFRLAAERSSVLEHSAMI